MPNSIPKSSSSFPFSFQKNQPFLRFSSYEFIRIKNDRKRSVIHKGYFHICSENPLFYNCNLIFTALNNIVIKFFCHVRFTGICKDGLFPFRQSAYKVNCDINNRLPFTSFNDKFVFPSESSKIRSPISFLSFYPQSLSYQNRICQSVP